MRGRHLIAAGLAAFAILFLEIVYFQQLMFLTTYMMANLVVAVALLGIAAGGLLAFLLARWAAVLIPLGLLLLGPAALGAGYHAMHNPAEDLAVATVMTLPFLLGALVVSLVFSRESRPALVYAADLTGAGLGALIAAQLVPVLRVEGCLVLAALPLALAAPLAMAPTSRRVFRAVVAVLALALLVGGGVLLQRQLTGAGFNLAVDTPRQTAESLRKKLYNYAGRLPKLYSKDSLIERMDVYPNREENWYTVAYNGIPNDHVAPVREHYMATDRRVPTLLFKGRIPAPEILVIGTAAEGICKTAKYIAGDTGRITGLEYNRSLVALVTEEQRQIHNLGKYWYEGIDLHQEDARTFLARTDQRYDLITMLNTHRMRTIGLEGPPEYLHTVEAVHEYLDHLTDEGALVIEERTLSPDALAGIHRYLVTISAALRERGLAPEDHLLVYEYYANDAGVRALTRKGITATTDGFSGLRYAILVLFKQPVREDRALAATWERWKHLVNNKNYHYMCGSSCTQPLLKECRRKTTERYRDRWDEVQCLIDTFQERGCECRHPMGIFNMRERHTPWKELDTTFRRAIVGPDAAAVMAEQGYHLPAVFDDRPFPQDVDAQQPLVDRVLGITAAVGAIFVVPPLLILALVLRRAARRREAGGTPLERYRSTQLLLFGGYSAIVGVGYLLIEIVFIQWFAIFMGSPAASLAIILPAMLILSGLGGLLAERLDQRQGAWAVLLVVVLALVFGFGLMPVLNVLVGLGLTWKIALALLLMAPLFVVMGVPFCFALRKAQSAWSPAYPALFFAINGALGALAMPMSIKLAMTEGYSLTLAVGAGLYVVALAVLVLDLKLERRAERR